MEIEIYYRFDDGEFIETDTTVLHKCTWEQVFREVQIIESHATVLSITRNIA